MQFEQQSIFKDENSIMELNPFAFSVPNREGVVPGVYPLVDYLTVIFKDCCVMDALNWLGLQDAVSDIYKSLKPVYGMDPKFAFSYNGIRIDVSRVFFYYDAEDLETAVFNRVIPNFRMDLPGSALNFLRSQGLEMYEHMREAPKLPPGGDYHFTRIDIAYDFINYAPTLFDDIANYALNNMLPSGRVPVQGLRSGLGCDIALAGRRQVTFGSSQSDRRLTFYDKRFQQINVATGLYDQPNAYNNPESWIRMEVRFRNKAAHSVVVGVEEDSGLQHNFKSILKDVYKRYQFMSKEIDGYHRREDLQVWQKLFTWEELDSCIIQNAKYVEFKTPLEKLQDGVSFYAKREMTEVSMFGLLYMVDVWNKYLDSLYEGTEESFRKRTAFFNWLGEIDGAIEMLHTEKEFGLSVFAGDRVYFKCSKRIKDFLSGLN